MNQTLKYLQNLTQKNKENIYKDNKTKSDKFMKRVDKDLRHPRKDKSCINSQARRKAKALDGNCECFEKQALRLIIIDLCFLKTKKKHFKFDLKINRFQTSKEG